MVSQKDFLGAAQRGDRTYFVRFLNDPQNDWSRYKHPNGDTALHVAAQEGHLDIVKLLLEKRPQAVDIGNNDSKTPLHAAAQFSRFAVVEHLLAKGANVDALKRSDWTPLMLACTKSGPDALRTVKVLLANGASTRFPNKDGWTPLHMSCKSGDADIVKTLLERDAASALSKSKNGRSALHIACLHGHWHVAKILLKVQDVDINCADSSGNTCLHEAVCAKNESLIAELIAAGADINKTNQNGFSAVDMAHHHRPKDEHCNERIISLLTGIDFDD